MFTAITKLHQAKNAAHWKLDTVSNHLIERVIHDLEETSANLQTAVDELIDIQKKCQDNEKLDNQEEIFLAAIASKRNVAELLNICLRQAAMSTRGVHILEPAIESSIKALQMALRFVTCSVCQHHFLGKSQVKEHHEMYHSHIPLLHARHIPKVEVEGEDSDDGHHNDNAASSSKIVHDGTTSLWESSKLEFNAQYSKDYRNVLRLKRKSVYVDSSSDEKIRRRGQKWNVDPKRWQSSMLYNANLTLKFLVNEQDSVAGNWSVSSGLAELMFCSVEQLRQNAFALCGIPFYSPPKTEKERTKQANVGDVMIHYLCTAAAIFHLNSILQTVQNNLRSSVLKTTKEAIDNGLKWMKQCVLSQNYGRAEQFFAWVSKNQQHWPSNREDDHHVSVHVRMIQSVGTTTVDRIFHTKISNTTPIHSLLMFLNCHFNVGYHYLQAYSTCEIFVRDRNYMYIAIDQLNLTANKIMSSVLDEQQRCHDRELEVIFRQLPNGEYPRFRACIPTQIAIAGIEERHLVQDVHIAIPHGVSLSHLRQIIWDEMACENNGREVGGEGNDIAKEDEEFIQLQKIQRLRKLEEQEEAHELFLQQKSEQRMKEIRKQYGTDKVGVIMSRSERAYQGSSLEWVKSSDHLVAQDRAMKLQNDLEEVDRFLEETRFVPLDHDEDDDDYRYISHGTSRQWKNKKRKSKALGREELTTLTMHGPSDTCKSFLFVHRGVFVLPEEEAGILALDNAIQTGSMGITSEMEQRARLMILLHPATGIDLGIDDDDDDDINDREEQEK